MVKFCRTIESLIQYYNWETSYRVSDHATANDRQLPIIKRPKILLLHLTWNTANFTWQKNCATSASNVLTCPLRYSVQGYLSEIVRFVSLIKPRGKITAPANFAEMYIGVGGEICKSSNVSKIFWNRGPVRPKPKWRYVSRWKFFFVAL